MSLYEIVAEQLALPELTSIDELESVHLQPATDSLQQVMKSALRCTVIGVGFAAGYRSALQTLLPQLDTKRWAAMCVTEAGGNHPRNIETTLTAQGDVSGEKSFVTMADRSPQLLVVARYEQASDEDGRPKLKAVLLDGESEQIVIESMPPLPMVPEVPHGKVRLNAARGEVLAGDGYSDYSKRFRTLEDAHVLTAFVSVLMSLAYRHQLPAPILERAMVMLSSIQSMQEALVSESPWLHLQLAGLFNEFRGLCALFEASLDQLPKPLADNWLRDKKLFGVANKARESRRLRAQQSVYG